MISVNKETKKEMQKVLLDILLAIDVVCKEHQLKYYLIAGTMLGAVRHNGFIPWDDDADVALPRKDYDLLVAHANEWLPEGYELVSGQTNPNYPYAFARIQAKQTTYILRRSFDFVGGVPVDIFPLDGMTSSTVKQFIHYRKYSFFKKLMYFSLVDSKKHGKGIYNLFVRLCQRTLSAQWLHYKLDMIQKEYDYDEAKLVADHDNKPSRGILPKDVYGDSTSVEFEGITLSGVQQPDVYLRYCYGEYMKMPDKIPPLNFRFMDLHLPYREFVQKQGRL
jgi:lipopolysaccharide cholinephosphotransferase